MHPFPYPASHCRGQASQQRPCLHLGLAEPHPAAVHAALPPPRPLCQRRRQRWSAAVAQAVSRRENLSLLAAGLLAGAPWAAAGEAAAAAGQRAVEGATVTTSSSAAGSAGAAAGAAAPVVDIPNYAGPGPFLPARLPPLEHICHKCFPQVGSGGGGAVRGSTAVQGCEPGRWGCAVRMCGLHRHACSEASLPPALCRASRLLPGPSPSLLVVRSAQL